MAATAPDERAADRPPREVRRVVERITYRNPDNDCSVARLAPVRSESEAGCGSRRTPGAISTEPGW